MTFRIIVVPLHAKEIRCVLSMNKFSMNDFCLLLSLFGIFHSVAIGVMAPLIGYGWPKGNPLKTLFASNPGTVARYPSADLKVNFPENSLRAIQS